MASSATAIADWAIASPLIDGVLFAPEEAERAHAVCAVAYARGFKGYGKGTTQSAALASAVGEALEQYAAAQIPHDRLIRASFRDLNPTAFDPRWLCLYSPEQYARPGFPYRPFREDEPRRWIEGHWMDTGGPVYLPASAVFLTAEFATEEFCQATSNGLGAGPNSVSAARRAAMELRERDAFVTSWIGLQNAVRIEPRIESEGAQLETYLVATGDPVFAAVAIRLGDGVDWPAVTLGLGAGLTAEEAIAKATLEHDQTGPYLADLWKNGQARIPKTPEETRTFEDHALYYCDPAHRPEFDAWRNSTTERTTPTRPRAARIATVDLTPPELMDSPFRIARAIAHGLQPIHAGHGLERVYTDELARSLIGRQANTAPLPIC